MHLNHFSAGLEPLDMTVLDEFSSLKNSANDLGISFHDTVRYHSRNTVVRHQRFHYLEWGEPDRPAVILLHGGNQSAHSWDLVSLNLSARYHVFALDQRGHGDSEWSRAASYGIDELADDVLAFIRELKISRPMIIGHSMGGMAALAAAVRRPDVPSAMVIIDIGPETNEQGTRMIRDFVSGNIEFDDLEEFVDRVEKYDPYRTRAHIERTIKYNLMKRADGRYVPKTDRRRFHPEGGELGERVPGAPSLTTLAGLTVPTLVVRGAESTVLDPDAARRFSEAMPGGELVTVARCGHNVASQNTTGFLAVVAPFLARHR
jgi:esterase